MENNANYALVGALATAVLVALVAFIYWFAGPTGSVATKPYDVVFTGTVTGISRGTDVLFNGIKVGQVNMVALDPSDTNRVIARIGVDATAPVKADTKVLMGFQGLTGVGSVQLSGGTQTAGEPVIAAGRSAPTLYAEVSDFQSLLDGLSSTVNGASKAVDRINTILDDNDQRLDATIANVETFSAALASNSEGVETFLASVSEVGQQIGPMAKEITVLSTDLRGLVDAVPPEQVARAVADISTFSATLADNSAKVDDFFDTTTVLADNLTKLTDGLSTSVAVIDQVAKEIDPAVVGRVLANVDTFSTQITGLLGAVPPEQVASVMANAVTFSDTLARNSGQIESAITNTAALTKDAAGIVQGLSGSVATVNEVVAKFDPELVGRVVANVDTASSQIATASGDLTELLAALPPEQVASVMSDAKTFSDALARNSGQIDSFFTAAATLAKDATGIVEGLSGSVGTINQVVAKFDPEVVGRVIGNVDAFAMQANTLAGQFKGLLDAVPPEQVASVVTNAVGFTDALARNTTQIDSFFAATASVSESLPGLVDSVTDGITGINQVVAKVDPELIGRVLANVDGFAKELGDNAGNVDTILANATTVSNSLVGSAAQVDAILKQIDDVVSSTEGQGMFEQITLAATSVRQLADQLNASTSQIAVGLNNFTSRGLSQYSALAEEARVTLQRFDRVVRNLEENPQGLIFGGDTVRDYNKQ